MCQSAKRDLRRHYTLSDAGLENINARRRPRNKLGFVLQLCVLRFPGYLLAPGELVRSTAAPLSRPYETFQYVSPRRTPLTRNAGVEGGRGGADRRTPSDRCRVSRIAKIR